MTKRVALYARVSTDGQSVENQLSELQAVAVKEGWEVIERFIDKGISGSKGRDGRPAFDALYKGIVRRQFDLVAAWSVDRLGRSLQDLVAFLSELHRNTRISTSTSKALTPPHQPASCSFRCSECSQSLSAA